MKKIFVVFAMLLALTFSGCSVSVDSKPTDEPTKTASSAPTLGPSLKAGGSDEDIFITVVRTKVPALDGVDDPTLLKVGNQVCTDFEDNSNITSDDLLSYVIGFSKGSGELSIKESATFVAAAGYSLCPETLKQPLDDFDPSGTNL